MNCKVCVSKTRDAFYTRPGSPQLDNASGNGVIRLVTGAAETLPYHACFTLRRPRYPFRQQTSGPALLYTV